MQITGSEAHAGSEQHRPFLSILIRTQGRRMGMLSEALLCLAAQTDWSFEVLLLAHNPTDEDAEGLKILVEQYEQLLPNLQMRTVFGGGRSDPLNEGLDHAAGSYVAFLDDDDLVLSNWVDQFHQGALQSGHQYVVRSQCVRQLVEPSSGGGEYRTVGPRQRAFSETFSALDHLHHNETPICSFAVPTALIQDHMLRFRTHLRVTEDWDFLVRSVMAAGGVTNLSAVASLYHWWSDHSGSKAIPESVWAADRIEIRRAWIRDGVLFDTELTAAILEAIDLRLDNGETSHGVPSRGRSVRGRIGQAVRSVRTS